MSLSIGTFFIIIGLICAFIPGFLWWLSIGWLLRDAEPSDAALMYYRVVGYIFLFLGVIYILDFFFAIT